MTDENFLNKINYPRDLRQFGEDDLPKIADELRRKTITAVAQTGGHLGAGLGVVELTIALHYVFDTPADTLVWDVGHQAYPHKILTGRKDKIATIRQPEGLAGFTRRAESEYDPFGAGHSSTSVSAALGINVGKKINGEKSHTIAVIGDGAMSAGMAYEAMNNAGALDDEFYKNNRLIVILNDNDMSIAPPTGAMSHYLSRLAASKQYLKIRDISKKITNKLHADAVAKGLRKFEKAAKEWWMGGNIFEEIGFYYIGPIDGHNLEVLVPILKNIRDDNSCDPILIHCVTQKGKGYNEIMQSSDRLHAVGRFDPETGVQEKKSSGLTYSKIFGRHLSELAKEDKKIVAITAAMPSGTGLEEFAKTHPERFFDVGIAEQHAVTFAAGLACEGIKPYAAIYSTFLQRAYDQVVHDVAVQNLPVKFAIDRAGFVGADGPTHAGSFDIAYLINLPNFVLMASSDAQELVKMINTANTINDRPCAFRFPRGESSKEVNFSDNEILEIGKARIIQSGKKIAIISYGSLLEEVLKAAARLRHEITIVDARFAKPFDEALILDLAKNHEILITVEEGAIGGFGSIIVQFLLQNKMLDSGKLKFRSMFMADKFIEQNSIDKMRFDSGISAQKILDLLVELNIL
ncbi:MAG TPA: 1-deoxy-D-xylulose-5-phosphate synthase [Rickettsiales bacterium]|nr:1-deoxy-D-xylulose-5-phosphate synthase [Rickettsiales bacterium]